MHAIRKSRSYERQEKRNAAKLEKDPDAEVKIRPYTGKPTFFDQILTSLITVVAGFVMATLIAMPLGILCGMSPTFQAALNPLIQIFKPVSPLAWLPLVTMVVSATYVTDGPMFDKSFLTSAITVTLCCLWPTMINTAVGVPQFDQDLINVSRVLRLSLVDPCPQDCAAFGHSDDFHRLAFVAGYRLDGADCSGDAGAKSGPGKVRLG